MAPLIHCVRHAQGYHNLGPEHWGLVDPHLTPQGIQQCTALASTTHHLSPRVSQVLASPLTRTLETAVLAFGAALASPQCAPNIIALSETQETTDLVSDTGLDIAPLRARCAEHRWPVDLSLVRPGWNDKTDLKWAPTRASLQRRARDARRFVLRRVQELECLGVRDPEVVLVSHGGFLHYFTEDWEGSGVEEAKRSGRPQDIRWDMPGTAWVNTELRTYQIRRIRRIRGSGEGDCQLVETEESRLRRGRPASCDPIPPVVDTE